MDRDISLKCVKLMLRLEMHPMYRFFQNFWNKKPNSEVRDLNQIKSRLILNEYRSKEEWLDDLIRFFKRVMDKKKSTDQMKQAAQSLIELISKKSKKIQCLELDDWLCVFSTTYQEMVNIIAESPPELCISECARPMQLAGAIKNFTEQELIQMKKTLSSELDDKSKKKVAQLLQALEPDAIANGIETEFDLERMSNDTLLAIQSFLKNSPHIIEKKKKTQLY